MFAAGPAAAGNGVAITGIEVTQAIQNLQHQVRLIAGKKTVVRVYLEPRGLTSNVRISGEIMVSKSPGTPGTFIGSMNQISLKATGHPSMKDQRNDIETSLNFLIPAPVAGPMTVRFTRAIAMAGGDVVPLLPGSEEVSVGFDAGVPFRVRALGLRYKNTLVNPPTEISPAATHFDHLRSFLTRAYPVPALDWTQAVIPADENFVPPFKGTPLPNGFDPHWWALIGIVHVQLMAIRQEDIDAGWDPRTHYYGLVADDAGFFRGAANDVPASPAPGTVAVGPVGRPDASFWDKDGSYGDWYGAHELAHTFGRRHPGFCNQSHDDAAYPYPGGRISDAAQDFIGLDVGDAALGLPMRTCPHTEWHDVMTYCTNQWISKYTYDGIFDRLVAEDTQFAPPTV